MIERLNGRTSVAISAAGLLLVVLVGWFGVVAPQRSKAAELSVKIEEAETQLVSAQALVKGSQLRLSTAELATLRTAIPDEVRMSQILRQLSKASADARVSITSITPQPAITGAGGADVVSMSVLVEGRYFGIRDFLRLLRTRADIRADKARASGRLFAVDSINFARGSATTGDGLIQATLTVAAFAFSGTVPVAAPGAVAGVSEDPSSEAATP